MKKVIIILCVIAAMATCQKIYEAHLKDQAAASGPQTQMEKDLRKNVLEVDQATADYNTHTSSAEIEKDINAVANGLIKTAAQEMLVRAQKIHVPDPMLQNTAFLYSKEKLDAAIRRQDADIKQYKKEINSTMNEMLDGGAEAALTECAKKYTDADCAKLKQALARGFGQAKTELYAAVPVYVDYIETELNAMRFISNNYNKFTTSGAYPHFTDAALQNQFMSKVQEIDRKGQAVAEMRNNAWKNAHSRVSKI